MQQRELDLRVVLRGPLQDGAAGDVGEGPVSQHGLDGIGLGSVRLDFQPNFSAISRAQLSYDDPLFTATTLPRRSSSFVTRGAPFFVTNWKSLFR